MISDPSHSYQSIILELRLLQPSISALESYNDCDIPAQEAIGAFTKIMDLVGRLVHNFSTTLTGLFKDVKRSQLRAYLESHTASMREVYRQDDRLNMSTIKIPVPDGMVSTYAAACDTLNSQYGGLQTRMVLITLETILQKHLSLDPTQWASLTGIITQASVTIDHAKQENVQAALRKVFVGNQHSQERTVADVVGKTMTDVRTVADNVLKFESAYRDASASHGDLRKLDQLIGKVVDKAKTSGGDLPRDYLQQLADLIRVAAVQFDMHGVIMAEMQRVEHNFTIGIARIVDAVRRS